MDLGRVVPSIERVRHEVHLALMRLKEHVAEEWLKLGLRLGMHLGLGLADEVFTRSKWRRLLVHAHSSSSGSSSGGGSMPNVYRILAAIERVAVELEELDEQLSIVDRVRVLLICLSAVVVEVVTQKPILGFLFVFSFLLAASIRFEFPVLVLLVGIVSPQAHSLVKPRQVNQAAKVPRPHKLSVRPASILPSLVLQLKYCWLGVGRQRL